MSYISELKLAVINGDLKKMEELSDIIFKSDNLAELKQASAMISEAIKLLEKERASTLAAMKNIQKMRQYAVQQQ